MILLKDALKIQFLFLFFPGLLTITCQKHTPLPQQETDTIVFLSNRDAPKREFDVFSMHRDGSKPTNLTGQITGIRTFSHPCLSHDGQIVLFTIFDSGQRELHALRLSDSISTRLTGIQIDNPRAQFFPDDQFILFVDQVDGKHQIFKIRQDGSDRVNLSQNDYDETEPGISGDGRRICYTSKRGYKSSIGLMNSDGSGQILLTDESGNDKNPAFSYDGSKIAFCSDRSGNFDIYDVEISGKKIVSLFTGKSHDVSPQFSPDERSVLFISNQRGLKYRDLILLDISSKKLKNLTESLNYINQNPVFSQDGSMLFFESSRIDDSEIYSVRGDGTDLKNLTNHPARDLAPAH